MKKLSLEQMKVVEGGWPQWAGGYYDAPVECFNVHMPDGTIAREIWGTEKCLWGLVKSDYKMLSCDVGRASLCK